MGEVGEFIFENLLCRYGAVYELVTDNGKPFIQALDYLADKYHIHHIKISPYNSQAQGIVERAHYGLRESLIKLCGKRLQDWPLKLSYATWSQRITTRKSTGHSPYYMAFGIEPAFPFDIEEATFLSPGLQGIVPTPTLIAIRARQLEKRAEDIEMMRKLVYQYRKKLGENFLRNNQHVIRDFEFKTGSLVLVRNSAEDSGLKNKYYPRYLGPFVVVRRNLGGAYTLAEMDGTISNLRIAAKRVIPYHIRSTVQLPEPNVPLDTINDRPPANSTAEDAISVHSDD